MESLLTRSDAARIIRIARQERDRYRNLQRYAHHTTTVFGYRADALHDIAHDILAYVRRALHKSPIKML